MIWVLRIGRILTMKRMKFEAKAVVALEIFDCIYSAFPSIPKIYNHFLIHFRSQITTHPLLP